MTQMSVCIITRDQHEKLQKCLQAITKYPWQIVVLDTGSTDDSLEVAKRGTQFVYQYQWQDDFAAAKNTAIAKADHDIVMILDTDEYMEPLNLEECIQTIEEHPGEVGRIQRINKFRQDENQQEYIEYINRIFDRREYEYQGAIHEQVVRKDGKGYQTYKTAVQIRHDGYDLTKEEYQKKAERNISLLEKELLKNPKDPYLTYQLGKSYYVTDEYEKAAKEFELAIGYEPDIALEYVEDLIETYGYALLKTKQVDRALVLSKYEIYFKKSADFLFLYGLILMNNAKFEEAIKVFLQATKLPASRTRGTNSYMAFYNAGVIKECLGKKEEALALYKMCGEYEPALHGIRRI